jgi:hypothetical protein
MCASAHEIVRSIKLSGGLIFFPVGLEWEKIHAFSLLALGKRPIF